MIILGIDPGLASVGYGVIETNGSTQKCIDYGVIYTPKEESLPQRLAMIERGMNALIDKFQPDEIALEELFFVKNITNGIAVAHARGVIVLTAIKRMGTLYEYTPLQVKQAITGYGRADKKQMQQMVKVLLKLKKMPKPDDAADGLAIAMTHHQSRRFAKDFQI